MPVAIRREALPVALLAAVILAMPAGGQPALEPKAPGTVDVRDRTTRSLEAACLAEQASPAGWCSAYLIGVADTLTAFGDGGTRAGVCKADYTIDQLPEIFLTWVRAHGAFRDLDMLAGVSLAFRTRWPCS